MLNKIVEMTNWNRVKSTQTEKMEAETFCKLFGSLSVFIKQFSKINKVKVVAKKLEAKS